MFNSCVYLFPDPECMNMHFIYMKHVTADSTCERLYTSGLFTNKFYVAMLVSARVAHTHR